MNKARIWVMNINEKNYAFEIVGPTYDDAC